MIEVILPGLLVLLFLTPIALAVFLLMLLIPMRVMGIDLRTLLREITYAEAVLVGLYSLGCAHLVGSLFSRFV